MLVRLLVFLTLAVLLAGCTRYQSRTAPGKPSLPSPYAPRTEASLPQSRSPLSIPATPAPANTAKTTTDQAEASLVPPLPRETVPNGFVVQPPAPPAKRATGDVVPASYTATKQPGKIEKDTRPEPEPAQLPSPFAKAGTNDAADANANFQNVRRLGKTAASKWDTTTTYEGRLVRRETVGGKAQPEEEVLYRLRKEPFAVSMLNTGEVGKGREVLFNPSQHGEKMHIIVGAGDSFFLKAGTRAPTMSPDSRTVTEKSRHNIRDAGFGNSIARFNSLVDKVLTGRAKPESLHFGGAEVRQDMPGYTLERVEQTINANEETHLPKGGKRLWFFDAKAESPSYGMPVLVITFEGGREVEYYRFDRIRSPAGLTDAEFDPERMGKEPKSGVQPASVRPR
jgi:hypothetical protein